MSDLRSARAVVSVVVEVTEGAWGPDCTIAQAERQAATSAVNRLRQLLSAHSGLRVVSVAATEVRLACAREER